MSELNLQPAPKSSDHLGARPSELEARDNASPRTEPQVISLAEQWDVFWFAPRLAPELNRVRIATGVIAIAWFFTLIMTTPFWLGEAGWAESEFSRKLIVANEGAWSSRLRISPLWSTSSPPVIQLCAGVGIILAGLSSMRLGGKAVALALWLVALFLAQRFTGTTGAFESYLIALLGYLVIAPCQPSRSSDGEPESPSAYSTLALRLIQLHTWLLIAAAVVTQLAYLTWWQGEAAWWLAATGHSNLLRVDLLQGRILLVNAITHAITLCAFVAMVALWPRRFRATGLVCGVVVAVAYALVADQVLYGGLLLAGLLTFSKAEHSSAQPVDPRAETLPAASA